MVNSIALPGLAAVRSFAPAGGNRPAREPGSPAPVDETAAATGDGRSTTAAIRSQQKEDADQAARRAAAEAAQKVEAKAKAPPPAPREPFFQRRVGLVDGTFDVFIDLVSQPPPGIVMARVFGPPANAEEQKPEPAAPLPGLALSAYNTRPSPVAPSHAIFA